MSLVGPQWIGRDQWWLVWAARFDHRERMLNRIRRYICPDYRDLPINHHPEGTQEGMSGYSSIIVETRLSVWVGFDPYPWDWWSTTTIRSMPISLKRWGVWWSHSYPYQNSEPIPHPEGSFWHPWRAASLPPDNQPIAANPPIVDYLIIAIIPASQRIVSIIYIVIILVPGRLLFGWKWINI